MSVGRQVSQVHPSSFLRRVATLATALLLVVAIAPSAAFAYWDFSGFLHNFPTVQYEYGEQNPDVASWGFRLSRNNCEAKALFAYRSTGNAIQVNIPGGCTNLDWPTYYNGHTYFASDARNTDEGCCDVYVNVRIAQTL